MGLANIHKLEKATILLLNLEGWDLKWTGKGSERWDAKGKTKKGYNCIIEMKFRNKHYPTKMLEKDKYDALMSLDKDTIKIYFVNDTKGNYLYYLNTLKLPKTVKRYCPDTTLWNKKKSLKDVYLLEEKDAIQFAWNDVSQIIRTDNGII
tara:strand:+ start:1042 stop:1491 length:450 start_codon:yes stop_codon:yes gene_type:complete